MTKLICEVCDVEITQANFWTHKHKKYAFTNDTHKPKKGLMTNGENK